MTEPAERSIRFPSPVTDGSPLTHDQLATFGELFDELDVGVVSVDPGADFATVNQTAAALLHIAAGTTSRDLFAGVIGELASRTINRSDVVPLPQSVADDPAAGFQSTWEFASAPTHLGGCFQTRSELRQRRAHLGVLR